MGNAAAAAVVGAVTKPLASSSSAGGSPDSTFIEAPPVSDGSRGMPGSAAPPSTPASASSLTPVSSSGALMTTEPASPMCGTYIRSMGGESAVSVAWV